MAALRLIVILVAAVAAPGFAAYRARRATQKAELRGYLFALIAIVGVGICAVFLELVHWLDDPPQYRPQVVDIIIRGVVSVPALAALALTFARWRRLPDRLRPQRSLPRSSPETGAEG